MTLLERAACTWNSNYSPQVLACFPHIRSVDKALARREAGAVRSSICKMQCLWVTSAFPWECPFLGIAFTSNHQGGACVAGQSASIPRKSFYMSVLNMYLPSKMIRGVVQKSQRPEVYEEAFALWVVSLHYLGHFLSSSHWKCRVVQSWIRKLW